MLNGDELGSAGGDGLPPPPPRPPPSPSDHFDNPFFHGTGTGSEVDILNYTFYTDCEHHTQQNA